MNRIRSAALGTGLRTSWRELLLPGGLLLGSWATALLGTPTHGLAHTLIHSAGDLLGIGFLTAGGLTVSRFLCTSFRRDAQLRTLIALGNDAPLGPLLSALDAELTSRPTALRPHLLELLEKVRALVARRAADAPSEVLPYLTGAIRKWLFEPAPPGPFPLYADALLGLAELTAASDCLPLLRDLRDRAAHIANSPEDHALRARANELADRILGPAQQEVCPPDSASFLRLLRRAARGSQIDRAGAERELMALGTDAVRAASESRPRGKWWWHLPGTVVTAGGLAIWYLWAHHIVVDPGGYIDLGRHAPTVLNKMSPFIRGLVGVGLAALLASWASHLPVAWSRYRTQRMVARLTDALSLIDGREAVEALLALMRSTERMTPDPTSRARSVARAARRLVDLPSPVAAELLVPHGDWFFRRPIGPVKGDEWPQEEERARALLAVIHHTWDPAARPLLRSWARSPVCPIRTEARAALDELEARIARQGTLLMPAPVSSNYLLRPAGAVDGDTDALLRASDAPSAVGPDGRSSEDETEQNAVVQAAGQQV